MRHTPLTKLINYKFSILYYHKTIRIDRGVEYCITRAWLIKITYIILNTSKYKMKTHS